MTTIESLLYKPISTWWVYPIQIGRIPLGMRLSYKDYQLSRAVITYVDGFNLYHAIDDLNDNSLKWLDLWSLSESLLKSDQTLKAVKYFSAYATWKHDAFSRHKAYVSALQARGITCIMGRFKRKHIVCKATCGERFTTHEEKETDVNIGSHLLCDALQGRFEVALVISADTDIMAAVRLAHKECPDLTILLIAPPKRKSRAREMKHILELTKGRIRKHRFPNNLKNSTGEKIIIPASYQVS